MGLFEANGVIWSPNEIIYVNFLYKFENTLKNYCFRNLMVHLMSRWFEKVKFIFIDF